MDNKTRKLIDAFRQKREAEGISLRALSQVIGVSFSSLARIERGEGEPDNNSKLRMLEWLGEAGRDAGLSFSDVAFVHFRASKNVDSKTIRCLLQAADALKKEYLSHSEEHQETSSDDTLSHASSKTIALSKPEMEAMAKSFRDDLGVKDTEPLDALGISISGVDVFVPNQVADLDSSALKHLQTKGSNEWSAMSVPLDKDNMRWAILRNDTHTIERQRPTYLEECWHILLGHKLTKIAKIADAYGRTYDSNEEHDAFFLASASLLPENAVIKAVKEKFSAAEIAQKFGTSPELVEYRIKRLGLWRQYVGREIKLADK